MTYEDFRQFLYDVTSEIEEGLVTNKEAFNKVLMKIEEMSKTPEEERGE